MADVKSRDKTKYEDMVEESEVLSPDEAQAQIAMILAKTKQPQLLTELGDDEIKMLAILQTISSETENTVIDTFCDNFMKLRVSLNRKGRDEVISVARAQAGVEEKIKKGIRQMISGVR